MAIVNVIRCKDSDFKNELVDQLSVGRYAAMVMLVEAGFEMTEAQWFSTKLAEVPYLALPSLRHNLLMETIDQSSDCSVDADRLLDEALGETDPESDISFETHLSNTDNDGGVNDSSSEACREALLPKDTIGSGGGGGGGETVHWKEDWQPFPPKQQEERRKCSQLATGTRPPPFPKSRPSSGSNTDNDCGLSVQEMVQKFESKTYP